MVEKYIQRFNFDISSFEETQFYFRNRSKQMAADGYTLFGTPFENLRWGCRTLFQSSKTNDLYQSIYVYKPYRGQAHLLNYAYKRMPYDYKFITSPGCKIYNWFLINEIPSKLVAPHTLWTEYQTIEKLYGDTKAERSGVFYMNHIDEGLLILEQLGASEFAKRAFCLHPVVQLDHDLFSNENILEQSSCNSTVMAYAMEYRSVANEYLAHKENVNKPSEIRLSPIKAVNDMLVADKVQNYKDFLLYHKNTHPRSKQLDKYFRLWLERLNISEHQFKIWFKLLCK